MGWQRSLTVRICGCRKAVNIGQKLAEKVTSRPEMCHRSNPTAHYQKIRLLAPHEKGPLENAVNFDSRHSASLAQALWPSQFT